MTPWQKVQNKIVSKSAAIQFAQKWRTDQLQVVFTNGCFDILHRGHVTYLAKAAGEGNVMVVGLNSDASVRRQGKGEDRPVNDEISRALILASLDFVDLVVVFDEDAPLALIHAIQPSVLVKGADYDADETDENHPKYIVGSKEVKANQGRVVTIDLEQGFSTTNIIRKLKG
jgi:D-glycero-beta-D-manno-heptose 1-phosphate adenylyltransferase